MAVSVSQANAPRVFHPPPTIIGDDDGVDNDGTSAAGDLSSLKKKKRRTRRRKNSTTSKTIALSRTAAIEQTYVHDVYSLIAASTSESTIKLIWPVRSFVKDFLLDFEPGSLVLDVGCGLGQYLDVAPNVMVVGMDRCPQWFQRNSERKSKLWLLSDVLYLPFRDEFFDGILCCGVLHHLSTLERRVRALREMARIMKIGARILLTVTILGDDLHSQDVLVKVLPDRLPNIFHHSSTTLTSGSVSVVDNNPSSMRPYGTFRSPSANSELDNNCYSFFKKAIKRFSLASNSFKNSFNFDTTTASQFVDNYPIELRHLDDDDRLSCGSSKTSSSTDVDSALSSFNRSSGCLSQTTASGSQAVQFPTSIISAIKDHLISWKTQLSQQWQSFELAPTDEDHPAKSSSASAFHHFGVGNKTDQQQIYHRFSLPISFWKSNVPVKTDPNSLKTKLAKNKIYASNGFEKKFLSEFAHDHKDLNLGGALLKVTTTTTTTSNNQSGMASRSSWNIGSTTQEDDKSSLSRSKILLQKSMSSESSRQTSVHCCQYKLLAYYSMPELSTLFMRSEKPDFHTTINQNDDLKEGENPPPTPAPTAKVVDEPRPPPPTPPPKPIPPNELNLNCISTKLNEGINKETTAVTIQKPKPIDVTKFAKKLLRQRSFSADYQPETVKLQPELPRRFSADPNIETHRYNQVDHIPHHQQISVDSEESFVTIIPNNACDSFNYNNDANMTDFELEEDADECTSNQMVSPNEVYSCSSGDEEAYCESLDQNISNDTSISSVMEATIKSVSKSSLDTEDEDEITTISSMEEISGEDDSYSTSASSSQNHQQQSQALHQFYHLFRDGELEQIIEEHVQNLHVIDSYYSECATSWCVVAEKIRVWTI